MKEEAALAVLGCCKNMCQDSEFFPETSVPCCGSHPCLPTFSSIISQNGDEPTPPDTTPAPVPASLFVNPPRSSWSGPAETRELPSPAHAPAGSRVQHPLLHQAVGRAASHPISLSSAPHWKSCSAHPLPHSGIVSSGRPIKSHVLASWMWPCVSHP